MELFLRVDPGLARELHDGSGNKPYTCSSLLDAEERVGSELVLQPDRLYFWRLTGLTPVVSERLIAFSRDLGGVRIGGAVFSISHVSTTSHEHPLAGQTGYPEFLARWIDTRPASEVTLYFDTPTTFRVGRWEQPFPLPSLVFGSLLNTWNAFSSVALGDIRHAFGQVVLSNWRGDTRWVELGRRRTVGFIGKFKYRVPDGGPELCKLMSLLAQFGLYSGVGAQTTHGLGQQRATLLDESP